MIDQFRVTDFEKFLSESFPGQWTALGLEMGELCYMIHPSHMPNDNLGVHIRSSMSASGVADEAGADSIRLGFKADGQFMKYGTYVTRVPGWGNRLDAKIRDMSALRSLSGDCRVCGKPLRIGTSKTQSNPDRPFASCENDHRSFRWLDGQVTEPFWASEVVKTPVVQDVILAPTPALDLAVSEKPAITEDQFGFAETEYLPIENPDSTYAKRAARLDDAVFTDEQAKVVFAPLEVPARVLASPGSGKTYCLKYRYAYMLKSGIPAENILCVTFVAKMAEEFLAKVIEVVDISEVAKSQITTIHAFFLRMLKAYVPEWSSRSKANDWEVQKIVDDIITDMIKDPKKRPAWDEVISYINNSYAQVVKHPHLLKIFFERALTNNGADTYYADVLVACREALDAWLETSNKFTFPYILYAFEKELEKPSFKNAIQSRIKHIMIDEGQDTFFQAIRILKAVIDHTRDYFIVGDQDQMMYRFTGADPEGNLMAGFEKDFPEGGTYFLSVNFRSSQSIVKSCLSVIKHNYIKHGGPYDDKLMKILVARDNAPLGSDPFVSEYADAKTESEMIVTQIQSMLTKGYAPDSFFIAMRTRAQGAWAELSLSKTDIPYINTSGSSFWDLPYIDMLVSFLSIALDGNDKKSFEKTFNVATKDFRLKWEGHSHDGQYYPNHCINKIQFLAASGSTVSGAVKLLSKSSPNFKWSYLNGLRDYLDFVRELREMLSNGETLVNVMKYISDMVIIPTIEYKSGVDSVVGADEADADDLLTVFDVAREMPDPKNFCAHVRKMQDLARAAKDKDWAGRVVIATIHKLKGLERDVVFGIGISESEDGMGGLLPHTFSLIEPPVRGKLPIRGMGRVEDELDIFFVLISRPRELLFLSTIARYRDKPYVPSRFLSYL